MVSGEIDAPPAPPEPAPGPIEAEAVEDGRSNTLVAFWPAPEVCEDDFDDVSALRTSMADDAAPRANNMAELQQGRTMAADGSFVCVFLSKRRAMQKNPIKSGFHASRRIRRTRQ